MEGVGVWGLGVGGVGSGGWAAGAGIGRGGVTKGGLGDDNGPGRLATGRGSGWRSGLGVLLSVQVGCWLRWWQ